MKADGTNLHWSPSLLYVWDIAASTLMARQRGLMTINLETGKPLDLVGDFSVHRQGDAYRRPVGAITAHPLLLEKILNGMTFLPHHVQADCGETHPPA